MDPVHGRVQDELEDVRVAVYKVLPREVKRYSLRCPGQPGVLLLEFVSMLNSFVNRRRIVLLRRLACACLLECSGS